MTPGRRTLSFQNFDQIMADVEMLLEGHTTVGQWSLAQICWHLSTVLRRVVDLPASTPEDRSQWVGEDQKRQVIESGQIPEGLPAPPLIVPVETREAREEAENLRRSIAYYQSSPGPAAAHRLFGPLSKLEWDRLQLIHLAHHLSFAIPRNLEAR
jgi:hypothetical protein